MYTVTGNYGALQEFSANAETTDEALYVTEAYLKRAKRDAHVVILRNGEPWLRLDLDAFTA